MRQRRLGLGDQSGGGAGGPAAAAASLSLSLTQFCFVDLDRVGNGTVLGSSGLWVLGVYIHSFLFRIAI